MSLQQFRQVWNLLTINITCQNHRVSVHPFLDQAEGSAVWYLYGRYRDSECRRDYEIIGTCTAANTQKHIIRWYSRQSAICTVHLIKELAVYCVSSALTQLAMPPKQHLAQQDANAGNSCITFSSSMQRKAHGRMHSLQKSNKYCGIFISPAPSRPQVSLVYTFSYNNDGINTATIQMQSKIL